MLRLRAVSDSEAKGYVKDVFDAKRAKGGVPDLHRVLALRPEVLRARETLRNAVSDGTTSLGRRREEMLHFFVATLGSCIGCVIPHGQNFCTIAGVDKKVAVQIGLDWTKAGLDGQDQAVLAFAEKLTHDHPNVGKSDLEKLRKAGFSDDNILDIITIVSYRNFSNRLHMAIGCSDPENIAKPDPELMQMVERRRSAPARAR